MSCMMMYQDMDALSPDEHLALEWYLFCSTDSGESDGFHRCWEADRPVVVVGRNGRVSDDVFLDVCAADGVPVLRRFSGGGAVVLGPGCLNYAVALPVVSQPGLLDLTSSFRLLLGRITAALSIEGLVLDGRTDLALARRKVSGNAQRRGRRALILHGTLLYDFDPALAARYLREPERRPAYRGDRLHAEFIGNLPLSGPCLRERMRTAWAELLPDTSEAPPQTGEHVAPPR